MNILLINPWITDFAAYDFWVKPLGLLYVASFLRERRHQVRLVDCLDRFQPSGSDGKPSVKGRYNTGKFRREIIAKPDCLVHVPRYFCRYGISDDAFIKLVTAGEKPDTILVSCAMTYWYPGAFRVISLVRELWPDVPVVLGGIYATLCPDHAREYSDSSVVITDNSPFRIIEAVEAAGGETGEGPVVPDEFDRWPAPAWELYDNLKTAPVLTTRGCPMRCTVCASRLLFDGFERADPEKTAAEILRLGERGVEDIAFCDDALLIDPGSHAIPLFTALIERKNRVRLHSPNGLHVRGITTQTARLMKQAGMTTVRLSLETASHERAQDFSSKVTCDEFRSAAEALYGTGYLPDDLGAYVLIGLPGQTMDEVLDTIAFSLDNGIKVRPALFSPVPGTVEFMRAVGAGMIRDDEDPLLQNNTLRTVDFWEDGEEGYRRFKKWLNAENERVGKRFLRDDSRALSLVRSLGKHRANIHDIDSIDQSY